MSAWTRNDREDRTAPMQGLQFRQTGKPATNRISDLKSFPRPGFPAIIPDGTQRY